MGSYWSSEELTNQENKEELDKVVDEENKKKIDKYLNEAIDDILVDKLLQKYGLKENKYDDIRLKEEP